MHQTRLSALGLAALVSLSTTVPVFAESMWVPRLGYSPNGVKQVFIDVQPEKASVKLDKAQKREAREAERAAKEAEKAAQKVAKQTQKDQKEAEKLATQALSKEQQRKQAEAQKIARLKARLEEDTQRIQNAPVEGTFYLYDMAQNRLIFPSQAKLEQASSDRMTTLPGFQVTFSEKTKAGVYDVAVKGSGHRSTGSLVVSDTVYWDALSPTLQGIGKFHCPQESGTFRAVEQCFRVSASDPHATRPDESTRLVQGGWYQPNMPTGMVKSTPDIARLTRLLLDIDAINPESMKFVTFPGSFYAQSKYPDILDEATWGLEYLVTAQRADGSMPEGMTRSIEGELESNTLLPASPNATALSIIALAKAAEVFEKEELSLSVKYLRAAERGWRYLEASTTPADAELMLVASDALWAATHQDHYAQAKKAWLGNCATITAENMLLLSNLDGLTLKSEDSLASWLVSIKFKTQNQTAQNALSQWVTHQYGYEPVPLVRDLSYTMASAWTDPLQWMASKTGEVATRFGQKMSDSGVAGMRDHVDQARLELRDRRETEAKKRLDKGVAQLSTNPMDRAYLGYALAMLNMQLAPVVDPKAPKPEAPNRYVEPVRRVKGFWRPEF